MEGSLNSLRMGSKKDKVYSRILLGHAGLVERKCWIGSPLRRRLDFIAGFGVKGGALKGGSADQGGKWSGAHLQGVGGGPHHGGVKELFADS